MKHFYVNNTAQQYGDHEVHEQGCYWLSLAKNTSYLGQFSDCHGAVAEAKRNHHRQSNGCATCSPACHTS
ncbi:hypothetical protein D9R08_16630 [Rhodophyticola porphyridii]|uniref:Uncharacterized protein n=1 Tax=Rhodophyticola porphyridii TaxID=1852017 RepID=A0A3L9Y123_9RHOB|nr:hypothetical protein D9R08_16630 [Rhodophyticola porphyridii]